MDKCEKWPQKHSNSDLPVQNQKGGFFIGAKKKFEFFWGALDIFRRLLGVSKRDLRQKVSTAYL